MIAALYVSTDGPYFNLPNVEPYDIHRDARTYRGPHKVIAHPPCERWGRYWGGGPMLHGSSRQKLLGDDNGCFAHALWCVRSFGGVLEHPEASHAWAYYGLKKPSIDGGWIKADDYGGFTCCVAQGHYGHAAQKLTWLYANKVDLPELIWGKCPNKQKLDVGYHSKAERKLQPKVVGPRLTHKQNIETPIPFRNLLLSIVGVSP